MKPAEISAIFASGGAGAIVMVLPIVYALHRLGPRLIFAILMCLSATATLAIVPFEPIAPLYMVPARLVQVGCFGS